MRICVCIIALTVLLAAPAVAQTYVYAPDSNPATGGGNSWPFNFSTTSGRFIQIILVQHLTTLAGPYKITDVAFSVNGTYPNSFTATQFQMRMSHSTLSNWADTNFANWQAPCPTNLIDAGSGFTYTVPGANAWADIGTKLDFGWDGKRNIALEIRYRGQNTSLGFACWSDSTMPRIWANSTSADNYVATTGSARANLGLKVRLTIDKNNVLLAPDDVTVGTTAGIVLVNMPAGTGYQVAASLGQTPLPLGVCRIGLTLDNVFATSVQTATSVFKGYAGLTSATGTATAQFAPPRIPALAGICVYHAAVTYDKTGVRGCTNTAGTMLK